MLQFATTVACTGRFAVAVCASADCEIARAPNTAVVTTISRRVVLFIIGPSPVLFKSAARLMRRGAGCPASVRTHHGGIATDHRRGLLGARLPERADTP